jgi:hypothetical protein
MRMMMMIQAQDNKIFFSRLSTLFDRNDVVDDYSRLTAHVAEMHRIA